MPQQQIDPQQQNMMARMYLLQSGIAMNKRLQVQKGQMGSDIKIPLNRMGIMTGVLLHITVPVTVTGTPVLSAYAPFNSVKTVTYTDFTGTQRTRTSAVQLWAASSMKQGDLLGTSPQQAQGNPYVYNTDIFHIPAAAGDDELKFSIYVPMAYDPNSDLTGAVLTSTNVGEHYITLKMANNLVGANLWESPYASGDVVTNGDVTVEAFQFYIQPQNMNAADLPVLDLSTVYGFEGGYESTENISAGQDKYINLPNNRSIMSTVVNYQNGNAFDANGDDLSHIDVIANSNTNFKEMTPRLVREIMRNTVNADLPPSTYYLGSRRQPILTQLYANVQVRLGVKSAAEGSRTISQFEVMYPSGAPLPGITIAS